MATPEEERAIRVEINQLIRTYIDLLKQAGISQDERNRRERTFNETLSQAGGNLAALNDLQSDLTIEVNNTSSAVRAMGDDFEGVSTQLGNIVTDLGNTGDLGRKILSTFKSLRNTTDKIRDDRDLTRVLSEKQLKSEKENLGVQQKRLDREITRGLQSSTSQSNINKLRADGNNLAADALISLKTGNTITEDQLDALTKTEGALVGLVGNEKERVLEAISFNKVTGKTLSNYTAIEAQINKAIQREKQLNKNMGLTSSIVEGLGKIPGLNRVFRAEDIEEVKNLAREALVEQTSLIEQANEARDAGNDDLADALELQARQVELTNRGSIASKVLGKSFGNFKEALTDPATILTAIGTTLFRIDGLIAGLEKGLGVSRDAAQGLRDDFEFAAGTSNDIFVNSTKLQDSFFKLKQEAGVFFDVTSQSSETFLNLTERLDLAGSSAANLTTLFRLQGKDTETIASNMFDSTNAMLQTSKTTASVKDILGDIGESSKGLQASLSANPGALAKAAVAARELGASLKDIEGVQKSLLDFEGSISAELEAELLTGKQLNLEKARTAALNNDLETVGKELGKQGVDLASFSNMNVIQQEKMAAAMGLSRDAMGEMLLKQQTQNMTLSEVRDKFGDQTYEQAKALSAQEKFNAAVEKVKDLFGSVMTVFAPIVDIIGMIVQPIAFIAGLIEKLNKATGGFSNALIGVAIVAKGLSGSFGSMFNPKTYIGFFKGLISRIKGLSFSGIGDKLKGALAPGSTDGFFKGLKDKFKGLSSPLKTLGDKLKGAFGGAADASKGIQFDPRMKVGGKFRDMASGRMVSEKAANAAGVFKPGTGPTAAAASGATDVASSTGATPAPADDGKALKKKMQNIAEGIKSFASTEVIKGALSMIVAAPGLIALGLASIPLKITEKLNGKAIQAAMKGIANGIKAFGGTTKGALALLIATPGLLALGLAAPGLALIGVVGTGIAAGLKGISVGMGSLGKNMANVIKGSIALSTLALPIAAASAAFSLLKGVDPGSMIAFSISLGILGAAAAILGNMLPQVALGALALTTLALPIAAASLAFSLLKGIDPSSMIAFSVSLGILGAAAAILGSMLPMVAMGALALTALALPIAAASVAFSLLKGIDTSMMIGFATSLGILGLAAAGFGMVSPLIIAGSIAIGALGLALLPLAVAINIAAPAMKLFGDALTTLSNIDYSGLLGLALTLPGLAFGVGILGGALLISAPGLLIGSLTLPLIAPAITRLGDALKGIDTATFFQFGLGMAALTAAFTLAGLAYPLIIGGSLALSVALIPLTAVLTATAPAMKLFGDALTTLSSIDYSNLLGLAIALPALAMGAGALALATPAIFLSSLSLLGLGLALTPLSNASEGLSTTSNSLIKISEAINALDIGKVTSLATAMGKLTLSLIGLAALGPLGLGALNIGGIATPNAVGGGTLTTTNKVADAGTMAATSVTGGISPIENPQVTTIGGETNITSNTPGGETNIANNTSPITSPNPGEDMRAMIEETVASTINALVPEMVASLKEGQGNVKVTNDNFNASSQGQLPDQIRNISNNNFA